MDRWDEAEPFAEFDGRPCWGGLDLASTTDIAAFVLVCPDDEGGIDVLPTFWIPAENARLRERRDRVPYEAWIKQKLIRSTPGDVIDFNQIREDILKMHEEYNIQDIAVDRWNSTSLVTDLEGEGVKVAMFGQGFRSMSAPSKDLEALVMGRKCHHGNNAVMRWMASNVSIQSDPAANIKPSKKTSTEKIDGIVALVMALARSSQAGNTGSVYDDRGITIL
jgi:phage terminase large subunit-like protein